MGGRIVEKDWGYEEVCVNEPTHCGKKMFIRLGRQCSLHYHKTKDETFHVLEGPVLMQVEERVFWAPQYSNVRIPPGTQHRFGAAGHSGTLVEFSSHHDDDDVVRLEPSGPLTMWKAPSDHKIVPVLVAAHEAFRLKEVGKHVVFTNGCFDILHTGHVHLLEEARKRGDMLIVGLNSDASVSVLKGLGRPIQSVTHRAKLLAALEAVDLVVVFDEDDPQHLIERICPDVLVKGGDYAIEDIVGAEFVKTMGGTVVTIACVEGSTSDTIARIKGEDSTTRCKDGELQET